MSIVTTDSYYTSTVDDRHLDEIKEDLKESNELIGYSHNDLEGTVTVIVDISEFEQDTDLRYYH